MDHQRKPIAEQTRHILSDAHEIAERLGHNQIGTAHLLYGLGQYKRGETGQILQQAGLQLDQLEDAIRELPYSGGDAASEMHLSEGAERMLNRAIEIGESFGDDLIRPEHLLMSVLRIEQGGSVEALSRLGISNEQIIDVVRTNLRYASRHDPGQSERLRMTLEPSCPTHELVLSTKFIAGILTFECPDCGGQFIRRQNVRRLYELIGVRTPSDLTSSKENDPPAIVSTVRCPDDANQMLVRTYMKAAVYVCSECSGIWIEHGQLETIWAKHSEGAGFNVSPIDQNSQSVTFRDLMEVARETLKLVEETVLEIADLIIRRGRE
ncbi:MAG: zf-TFIIB domain-containing protein [Chloroflexi bacterium]|nr:zf-TFIIB domain-containing protein [Chloroflexota bacterium]